MKIFCERLKELREDKGITKSQLEKEINVSNGLVGKWEKGLRTPTIDNLYAVAVYFGVTSDYLLGLED